MNKLLKIVIVIVIVIVIAVLLIISAVMVYAYLNFDTARIKNEISTYVWENYQRKLEVNGEVSANFYPLGVSLHKINISERIDIKDIDVKKSTFVEIGELKLSVDVMQLLQKKVQIDNIELADSKFNVVRYSNGKFNFSDLTSPKKGYKAKKSTKKASKATDNNKKTQTASSEPKSSKAQDHDNNGINWTLSTLKISNLALSYKDDAAKAVYKVNPLNILLKDFTFGKEATFTASAKINVQTPTLTKAISDIKMSGRLRLEDGGAINVSGFNVDINANADIKDTGSVAINSLTIAGGANHTDKKTSVKISKIDGDIKSKIGDNDIDLNLISDLTFILTGSNFVVDTKAIKINGEIVVAGIAKPLDVDITGGASANSAANTASVKLVGSIDKTNLELTSLLKNFDKPETTLALKVDRFDLDEWFPAQSKSAPAPSKVSKTSKVVKSTTVATNNSKSTKASTTKNTKIAQANVDTPIDLSALIGLKTKIDVQADWFKARGIVFEKVNMAVNADGKDIVLNPLSFDIAEGHLQGNAKLNPVSQSVNVNSKITKVNFGKLLIDMGVSDIVRGRANLNFNLNTAGKSVNAFKQALAGNIGLLVTDGGVKGFNLAQAVRKVNAALGKGKATKAESSQELYTDFAEMSADFVAKQGVLTTKNIKALSPYMRLAGSGSVDIAKEDLDFRIKVKLIKSNKGQGENIASDSGIPVKITGKMTEPKVNIDVDSLKSKLINEQKEKLKKELDVQKSKLKAENESKINAAKAKAGAVANKKIENEKKKLLNKLKGKFGF